MTAGAGDPTAAPERHTIPTWNQDFCNDETTGFLLAAGVPDFMTDNLIMLATPVRRR